MKKIYHSRDERLAAKRVQQKRYDERNRLLPGFSARLRARKHAWRKRPENWEREKIRQKERRASDPAYRFLGNMRNLLRITIKSGNKSKQTEELLGCSIQEFMVKMETRFTEGMTWDKFGNGHGRINIDHILPCSLFDLCRPEHQAICFHYSNLQPMWWQDNRSKSDILPDGRLARNLTHVEKLEFIIRCTSNL